MQEIIKIDYSGQNKIESQSEQNRNKGWDPVLFIWAVMIQSADTMNKVLGSALSTAESLTKEYQNGQEEIDQINNEYNELLKNEPKLSKDPAKAQIQQDEFQKKLEQINNKLNFAQANQQNKKTLIDAYWKTDLQTADNGLNTASQSSAQSLFQYESAVNKINFKRGK